MIGVLVGLLARPFMDMYVALRWALRFDERQAAAGAHATDATAGSEPLP